MNKFIKILLWLNLAVILVLAVVYPSLMISPGPVIKGHHELATDCFACHTPLLGARSEKCISCHKVDDIGLRTTKGQPIIKNKPMVAFHQKLLGQDCVACHSDHEGVIVFREVQKFSHALVDEKTLKQCVGCHAVPSDKMHQSAPKDCLMCHTTEKWKPATFKHELLPKAELNNCQSCHLQKTPKDRIHENASKIARSATQPKNGNRQPLSTNFCPRQSFGFAKIAISRKHPMTAVTGNRPIVAKTATPPISGNRPRTYSANRAQPARPLILPPIHLPAPRFTIGSHPDGGETAVVTTNLFIARKPPQGYKAVVGRGVLPDFAL